MPNKKKQNHSGRHRRNSNKQHPKHFARVYWPYLPVIAVVVFGMLFTSINPKSRMNSAATLAYATEMSIGGLLSHTNQQRANNGLPPLSLNSKLNAAAQAKANDMVTQNYWSHNSPSGQEPWVFFDAAGYEYQKAGENLAYGYATSSDTVAGWMGSASHRANILDSSYTEVGFGFTNSSSFVGDPKYTPGEATVIVAHYAKPYAVAAPPPAPPNPAPKSQPSSLPAQTSKAAEQPEEVAQSVPEVLEPNTPPPSDTVRVADDRYNQPVTSDNPVPTDLPSTQTTRLQVLTGGRVPWSAAALSGVALVVVIIWLVKHAFLVKKYFRNGEHFVAHHPIFDLVVVMFVALAVYLSQSSGVVL